MCQTLEGPGGVSRTLVMLLKKQELLTLPVQTAVKVLPRFLEACAGARPGILGEARGYLVRFLR